MTGGKATAYHFVTKVSLSFDQNGLWTATGPQFDTKAGILLEYVDYTSTDVWVLHNYSDHL